MAELKTCLLISNDPDDHQILFEAIKEISSNIALTVLMEGEHLYSMLRNKKIQPDFIVVDVETEGVGMSLLKHISNYDGLSNIPIIIYTDEAEDIHDLAGNILISKQLPYSEIRSKLKSIFEVNKY